MAGFAGILVKGVLLRVLSGVPGLLRVVSGVPGLLCVVSGVPGRETPVGLLGEAGWI